MNLKDGEYTVVYDNGGTWLLVRRHCQPGNLCLLSKKAKMPQPITPRVQAVIETMLTFMGTPGV